jgi:hypothetical protein
MPCSAEIHGKLVDYVGAYPLVVLDLVVEFLALLTHAKTPCLRVERSNDQNYSIGGEVA